MMHPTLIINAKRDPTRTAVLRGEYVRAMRTRFGKVKKLIKQTIIDNDALRLAESAPNSRTLPVILQAVPAPRYAFPTDLAGKAQAFMDWLAGASDSEILEVTRGAGRTMLRAYPWQNTYVRSAYARGVTQASAQLRQAGIEIPPFTMAAVFNYPMHADTLALLFSRNFTDLKGITDEMSTQIARVLADGLSSGVGPREVAKMIADRVNKIGLVRGDLLARTEIIRAHAEATLNRYQEFQIEGVTGDVEIDVAGDACEKCKDLVGKEMSLDEARGIIPVHPRCLPGDSLVTPVGQITGASDRWYEGQMIIIRTAGGKKLTCTPNHPILTKVGWVAAHLLNTGDHVIGDRSIDGMRFINQDNQNVPTRIEEIANAFLRSGEVITAKVPVSPEYFHGDGEGSQVAVIGTNRFLRDEIYPPLAQQFTQSDLILADFQQFFLDSLGMQELGFCGDFPSSYRIMSRFGEIAALPFIEAGHPDKHRLADVSGLDAGFTQPIIDDSTGTVITLGQSQNRFPALVQLNQLIIREIPQMMDGYSSDRDYDSLLPEHPNDNFRSDPEIFSEGRGALPGPEFYDQIIDIDIHDFCGHVYNLETEHGFYVADGIINHNCRCSWKPVINA